MANTARVWYPIQYWISKFLFIGVAILVNEDESDENEESIKKETELEIKTKSHQDFNQVSQIFNELIRTKY